MNATPAAPIVANAPALNPGMAVPTAAPIAPSPAPSPERKAGAKKPRTTTRNGKDTKSSKPKSQAIAKGAGKSSRLRIRATRKSSQESWTVATSTKLPTKGSKQISFRVRVSDVGYRVCLVYYDEQGKRREPYLCYLSANEWKQAKRSSLPDFAKLVTNKLTERAAKEGADNGRLDELKRRVSVFL